MRVTTWSVQRALLSVLTLSAAYVGAWAQVAPHSFYASFPGLHHHWIKPDGPYNEHLIRDVGGFYLGLCAAGVLVLVRGRRGEAAVLGVAWSVFSALHLAYHGLHLGVHAVPDRVALMIALGGTLVASVLLTVQPRWIRPLRDTRAEGR
jgi:hypothetical protein